VFSSQNIYAEARGVFESHEGEGRILKIIAVSIVVIMMGPGFSSLGGKICKKKYLLEKARPHRYSIGGRVDKSFLFPGFL
jgi:hypothetical protein